jgi:hypothetical protein
MGAGEHLSDAESAEEHADPFADVHAFCLFVGYSRSGHSLVGALLDAHPGITIAESQR